MKFATEGLKALDDKLKEIPAKDLVTGLNKRAFPGQCWDMSLRKVIDELAKKQGGDEEKALKTAKKILEQGGRLLEEASQGAQR